MNTRKSDLLGKAAELVTVNPALNIVLLDHPAQPQVAAAAALLPLQRPQMLYRPNLAQVQTALSALDGRYPYEIRGNQSRCLRKHRRS